MVPSSIHLRMLAQGHMTNNLQVQELTSHFSEFNPFFCLGFHIASKEGTGRKLGR